MKINGRLLLLAVVTGLFMRIWAEAGLHREAVKPVSHRTLPTAVAAVVPGPVAAPASPAVTERLTESLAAGEAVVQSEEWTSRSAPISLPHGLTAGTWRVVDDTGRVARLELGEGEFPAHEGQQTEFHVASIEGQRWYFIRLNSPERIASGRPVLEAASTPVPQPVVDAAPVTADAGNPGSPGAGGELVQEVVDPAPPAAVEPVAPRSDEQFVGEVPPVEQSPVPVMAEPLNPPPAASEIVQQALLELQPEDPVETSGGISNRKFDFRGFDSAIVPNTQVSPSAVSAVDTTTERPSEVDMPEEV
jgi:hypothetical protein